jgi:hypothetical protein
VSQCLRQRVQRKLYLTCHPRSNFSQLSAVATLATASEAHILQAVHTCRHFIQDQKFLGFVSCRNACDSECSAHFTGSTHLQTFHPRSKKKSVFSRVATLATASAAPILLGKYVIQDQEFLGHAPCRNACNSKSSAHFTVQTFHPINLPLRFVVQNAWLCPGIATSSWLYVWLIWVPK